MHDGSTSPHSQYCLLLSHEQCWSKSTPFWISYRLTHMGVHLETVLSALWIFLIHKDLPSLDHLNFRLWLLWFLLWHCIFLLEFFFFLRVGRKKMPISIPICFSFLNSIIRLVQLEKLEQYFSCKWNGKKLESTCILSSLDKEWGKFKILRIWQNNLKGHLEEKL